MAKTYPESVTHRSGLTVTISAATARPASSTVEPVLKALGLPASLDLARDSTVGSLDDVRMDDAVSPETAQEYDATKDWGKEADSFLPMPKPHSDCQPSALWGETSTDIQISETVFLNTSVASEMETSYLPPLPSRSVNADTVEHSGYSQSNDLRSNHQCLLWNTQRYGRIPLLIKDVCSVNVWPQPRSCETTSNASICHGA